jgi:hypothetical protein
VVLPVARFLDEGFGQQSAFFRIAVHLERALLGDPSQPHPLFVAAVGTASFIPQASNSARFEYTIGAVSGVMQLVRFTF